MITDTTTGRRHLYPKASRGDLLPVFPNVQLDTDIGYDASDAGSSFILWLT
jgi:hypothetical protein